MKTVWTRENSNAGFWRLGRTTVDSFWNGYEIILELINQELGAKDSIFALDDVFFTNDFCFDSTDINSVCTFSDNLCEYYISSTSNEFKWQLFVPDLAFPSNPNVYCF